MEINYVLVQTALKFANLFHFTVAVTDIQTVAATATQMATQTEAAMATGTAATVAQLPMAEEAMVVEQEGIRCLT